MALIIGGKDTLSPVIATVAEVEGGLYSLVNAESDESFEDVVNKGSIEFRTGDKVLVLFDDSDQPYIDDIGTVHTGYNFVAITEVVPLNNKVAIPDNDDTPEIIRTNATRVVVRGSTYRSITDTSFPTITVNGTQNLTLSQDQMSVRLQEGLGTPYIDFAFEYVLNQGDRVYSININSDNGSVEVVDAISIVRDTGGPTIKSASFSYPGQQVAVKQGDTMRFVVTTDLEAAAVIVQSEAFGNDANLARVETTGDTATWMALAHVNGHIDGEYDFTVIVEDDLSNQVQRTNQQLRVASIVVDQEGPSLHIVGVTYPGGQYALKAGERCSIELVATDFSTIEYVSEYMEIVEPTTYESSKIASSRGNTPSGEIPVTVRARKQSNNSITEADVNVVVDNESPAVTAIVFRRENETDPLRTRILAPGVYRVTFITNVPLKEAPGIDVTQGALGVISGNARRWSAVLTILPEAQDEGHFENFNLRSRSNILSGAVTANVNFQILSQVPQVMRFVASTQYGPIILNGENVELTLQIDISGEHQNSNIIVTVDASPFGGPTDLVVDTLLGQDTLQGSFVAQIASDATHVTCTASIEDRAGNVTTVSSSPVDVWAISKDYLDNRDHLVRGLNRIGWLQLLAQPAHFTTVVYRDAISLDIGRDNTLNTEDAIVEFGCVTVPSNALPNTTYTFMSDRLQFNVSLSKNPFIYVDGWSAEEEDVYPEVVDLSSYSLTLNDPQISVYVNGDGSNNWALVRDFSRDVSKRRLRTQINLKATNLYLDASQIDDQLFFRIDLKTDAASKAPRVANFGVCYYGLRD